MGVLKSLAKYELSKATGGLSERKIKSNLMAIEGMSSSVNRHKENLDSNNLKERNMAKKTASYKEDYLKGLASAGALASVALGVAGARKLHSKMETESVWRDLVKENPSLANDSRARENFEVLQRFSPDIASNITTARSYMERMSHTNMTPHEFVKDLAGIQKSKEDTGGVGRSIQLAASRANFDFNEKGKKR